MSGSKPNGQRPRTSARLAAVQALFQSEAAGLDAEGVIEEFIHHRLGRNENEDSYADGRVPDADVPLFGRIVRAVAAQQAAIDAVLAAALMADWPMSRLDPVLRAALRCGAAELWLADGPPVRVVINEYMDVAHGFFEGDEPGVVNGVLDKVARQLRPAEFAGPASA